MGNKKLLLTITAALLSLFAVAGIFLQKQQAAEVVEAPRVSKDILVKPYSPTIGNPDAKVVIVEFLDPECESCAAFYPMIKGVVNDYKDKVFFVVRYMLFHENSKLAALATEAAGKQGKYFEMQGTLFSRKEWTHQQSPQQEKFEQYAKELGLDIEKFRADMKDPQTLANIENDYREGPTIGVRGTPTLFVNGRMLDSLSYSALKKSIEDELAR